MGEESRVPGTKELSEGALLQHFLNMLRREGLVLRMAGPPADGADGVEVRVHLEGDALLWTNLGGDAPLDQSSGSLDMTTVNQVRKEETDGVRFSLVTSDSPPLELIANTELERSALAQVGSPHV